MRALRVAEALDALRVIPRLALVATAYVMWTTWVWFTGLPDPSGTQVGFAGTVWATGSTVTGWYLSTGRKWT